MEKALFCCVLLKFESPNDPTSFYRSHYHYYVIDFSICEKWHSKTVLNLNAAAGNLHEGEGRWRRDQQKRNKFCCCGAALGRRHQEDRRRRRRWRRGGHHCRHCQDIGSIKVYGSLEIHRLMDHLRSVDLWRICGQSLEIEVYGSKKEYLWIPGDQKPHRRRDI